MLRTVKQTRIATATNYTYKNVFTERFSLAGLHSKGELNGTVTLEDFRQKTGLADLFWQAMYYQQPGQPRTLSQALAEADGYVIFMHGWTGSHRIWESLPLQLTSKHQNIVCFGLDVNGFGQSPFIADTPTEEQCNPPALMAAVELWMIATNLWPGPFFRTHKPFYLFAGHSMSGAALFYKDNAKWQNEVFGAYALAPALFCNDAQRQTFFKTVGASIGLPSFGTVKTALAPHAIEITGAGASPDVKNEHLRIFSQTSFGTLAQTLYALGSITPLPGNVDWSRYKVALGRKDMLVSTNNSLSLLSSLKFKSSQIRVTPGDHYFFSYGEGSPLNHQLNRQAVFDDLLTSCCQLSTEAKTV